MMYEGQWKVNLLARAINSDLYTESHAQEIPTVV